LIIAYASSFFFYFEHPLHGIRVFYKSSQWIIVFIGIAASQGTATLHINSWGRKYLKPSHFPTEKFVFITTKCQSMLLGDAARGVRYVGNCLRKAIVASDLMKDEA